jgi:hypothetical protein
VQRVEQHRRDIRLQADAIGCAQDDGLDLERTARAKGEAVAGAAALCGGAGVHDPAA